LQGAGGILADNALWKIVFRVFENHFLTSESGQPSKVAHQSGGTAHFSDVFSGPLS
jgi:hypothetical protein